MERLWRNSLLDHPTGTRVRLTPAGLLVAPLISPYTSTAASPPQTEDGETFETLVSQIRRIGDLQDVMLNAVEPSGPAPEDSTTGGEDGDERTDRDRTAVAGLRVREARLRAMQTRIDLLVNEFNLLRDARRELRRVCDPDALFVIRAHSRPRPKRRRWKPKAEIGTVPIPLIRRTIAGSCEERLYGHTRRLLLQVTVATRLVLRGRTCRSHEGILRRRRVWQRNDWWLSGWPPKDETTRLRMRRHRLLLRGGRRR